MLATSTLPQKKARNMLVRVEGALSEHVTSKDIVLHACQLLAAAHVCVSQMLIRGHRY